MCLLNEELSRRGGKGKEPTQEEFGRVSEERVGKEPGEISGWLLWSWAWMAEKGPRIICCESCSAFCFRPVFKKSGEF